MDENKSIEPFQNESKYDYFKGHKIEDLTSVQLTKARNYGENWYYMVRFTFSDRWYHTVPMPMPDPVELKRIYALRDILVKHFNFEEIPDPYLPPEALDAKLIWRRRK